MSRPPLPRPRTETPADLGFVRRPMVSWLSPKGLAVTGMRVVLSSVFGVYADKREIQAGLPGGEVCDYSDQRSLWMDYISDLGDGFDATYQMAVLLGHDKLALPGDDGQPIETRAGRFLVMGGDEVYPVACKVDYEDRLYGPYRAALPWSDDPRDLFAIPGNHDWYDGLSSFMRVFCQRDWIGGWRTRQSRSYFALKLPHRWWLWGIDIQFDTYIDDPQRHYFDQVVGAQLQEGDNVILCSAKPSWVKVEQRPDAYANLDYFDRKLIRSKGARVRLFLTGDLHHYARYEPVDPGAPHLVTAGGGGAFLSATHHLPPDLRLPPEKARDREKTSPSSDFRLAATYPDRTQSKRLRWGVLALPFRNPGFWILTGALYSMYGWIVIQSEQDLGASVLELISRLTLGDVAEVVLENWLGVVFMILTILGMAAFTQEESPLKRWALGGVHGVAHVAVALASVRVAGALAGTLSGVAGWVLFFAVITVLGGLAGSMLMAVYLLAADRFECNSNELYAAQMIKDKKCFLRLHLDEDGGLTMFPIAVDRVGRSWRLRPEGGSTDPWFEPTRPGTEPRLIEPPVRIEP